MKDTLYILDIKKKQKDNKEIENLIKQIRESDKVLSLTPLSHYILEFNKIDFKTFHDLISIADFREKVLNEYQKIDVLFKDFRDLSYLLGTLMRILTYQLFVSYVFSYIDELHEKYTIVYITDKKKHALTFQNIMSNQTTLFHFNPLINKIIYLNNKDTNFYKITTLKYNFNLLLSYRNEINKIIKFLLKKYLQISFLNPYLKSVFTEKTLLHLAPVNLDKDIEKIKNKVLNVIAGNFKILYENIFDDLKNVTNNYKIPNLKYKVFSYLDDHRTFYEAFLLKKNSVPTIFFQHGNYIYAHFFLKNCEIEPASINFVINDYTNQLFQLSGAKNVVTIGSTNFNQPILEKNKKFDYLYITYNSNYIGNGSYVESKDCLYSFDGYEIYQRHKSIIEYFGIHLKSKKICIKMHPLIISVGLYAPVIELSKRYKNITIDFSTSMQKLIEESKLIISDYFSSEFLNREIHYKRDIILFKGAPIPLPISTLEDMTKMFILVDTVDDLKETVENIKEITKNRKRYDDIIEYYSSKECDTKKIVTKVLKKEFDGR